jgi:predicted RNA-binding Zn-ribbon protein involved in translation (DUF1610 family)
MIRSKHWCPHCHTEDKWVTMVQFNEAGEVTLTKSCSVLDREMLGHTEQVTRVWCPECGTLFHEESI